MWPKNLGTPTTPLKVTRVTCRDEIIIFYCNLVSRDLLDKLQVTRTERRCHPRARHSKTHTPLGEGGAGYGPNPDGTSDRSAAFAPVPLSPAGPGRGPWYTGVLTAAHVTTRELQLWLSFCSWGSGKCMELKTRLQEVSPRGRGLLAAGLDLAGPFSKSTSRVEWAFSTLGPPGIFLQLSELGLWSTGL